MSTFYTQYNEEIRPKLIEDGMYRNIMEVPRITKVVISSGIGYGKERETFNEAVRTFSDITGQRPVISKTRKNIAGFKLRKGNRVGVFVTLRGEKMYDFLLRLICVSLPRVRDFRGISPKSFDGRGNFSLGITDQTTFTEVNLDKIKHTIGMNVTIVTTAKTNKEGFTLLSMFGFPFKK